MTNNYDNGDVDDDDDVDNVYLRSRYSVTLLYILSPIRLVCPSNGLSNG